jgi:hypothetical protein
LRLAPTCGVDAAAAEAVASVSLSATERGAFADGDACAPQACLRWQPETEEGSADGQQRSEGMRVALVADGKHEELEELRPSIG